MKYIYGFRHLPLVYFLVLMCSCTTEVEQTVNLKDCSKSCDFFNQRSSEISAKCAKCMERNFKVNSYRFPRRSPRSDDTRGFAIWPSEVRQLNDTIISDSIAGKETKVYGMLGIYFGPNPQDSSKNDTFAHQIFTLERIDTTTRTNDTTYLYYDFVRPCPNYCPGQGDGSENSEYF